MPTVAALFPSLGLPELLVIFLIFVLIFGASKLPQLGRGLGEGIKNFKQGIKGGEDKVEQLPRSTSQPTETRNDS
ncbi:MAG TPA: twin-arginine translocase TatA/TatE family subunit [Thermoanaerobaculia bacterium]|nr:twin-arginine translocase TatA/TatE family subunit [Thermoanaerobaculia bacterium]